VKHDVSEAIEDTINGLLKENPDAQAAFKAMRNRGYSERVARDEIGRAALALMWECGNNKVPGGDVAKRAKDVFALLAKGASTTDLWPE
jgi:hypothetical protein